MKTRTIILFLILFALILAVFLFPRRSASDQEPVADPSPSVSALDLNETDSETKEEENEPDPTPEATDTPELGGEDEEVIEIEDNQSVGGL